MSEVEKCKKIVHQMVEVEANITVKPIVKHGKPKVSCGETDIHSGCSSRCDNCKKKGKSCGKCTYSVHQVICVEIPVNFDVEVDVDKGITKCGKPHLGPCDVDCGKDMGCSKDDYTGPSRDEFDIPTDCGKLMKKSRKHKKVTKRKCNKYDDDMNF